MPDYTQSSEYILRDVFSTVNTVNNAQTFSAEQIMRAVYDSSLEALQVYFTISENSLKVNY